MTNNIPPKQTRNPFLPMDQSAGDEPLPVDPLAGLGPQHGLVMHNASAHGDAAFPVLKAFQAYLEMERQQARTRLVTLTIFFVSLMTLVVAGFIIAFVFAFGNMAKREDRLLDEALKQKSEAQPSAAALADLAAQQATRDFHAVAQNLQNNIGAQLATMGSNATNLNSKLDAQNLEMTKLREALAALQKENANILTNLPKLALEAARQLPPRAAPVAPPPVLALALPPPAATVTPAQPPSTAAVKPAQPPPVAAVTPAQPPPAAAVTPAQPPPAATRPAFNTASPATTTAGTPAATAGKSPKGYEETVLQIHSHDSDDNIPWRTFVTK